MKFAIKLFSSIKKKKKLQTNQTQNSTIMTVLYSFKTPRANETKNWKIWLLKKKKSNSLKCEMEVFFLKFKKKKIQSIKTTVIFSLTSFNLLKKHQKTHVILNLLNFVLNIRNERNFFFHRVNDLPRDAYSRYPNKIYYNSMFFNSQLVW